MGEKRTPIAPFMIESINRLSPEQAKVIFTSPKRTFDEADMYEIARKLTNVKLVPIMVEVGIIPNAKALATASPAITATFVKRRKALKDLLRTDEAVENMLLARRRRVPLTEQVAAKTVSALPDVPHIPAKIGRSQGHTGGRVVAGH